MGTGGTCPVYGSPTLRAMHQSINVSQRALHIYWQFSAMSRITAKVKTVICEQAPNHGSYFVYARLIARVNFQFISGAYSPELPPRIP